VWDGSRIDKRNCGEINDRLVGYGRTYLEQLGAASPSLLFLGPRC
jgi:hypothetical protein